MRALSATILALSLQLAPALAGGFAGNGADNARPDDGAAWFLGPRPVRYCFVAAHDFGVPEREIGDAIRTAFGLWRDYVQAKRLNDPRFHDYSYAGGTSEIVPRILVNVEALRACDGSEDLKFYLGVQDDSVARYAKQFHRPTAFSQLVSRDAAAGWAKGFVWVAGSGSMASGVPSWGLPHRLQGVLLHEIGHILGNGHVSGTIMDESLGSQVLDPSVAEVFAKARFSRIDTHRELLLCRRCPASYVKPFVGLDPRDFEALLARKAVGAIDVAIEGPLASEQIGDDFTMRVQDLVSRSELEIRARSKVARILGDSAIFKRALRLEGSHWEVRSLATESIVYAALLREASAAPGAGTVVLVSRNLWDKDAWGGLITLQQLDQNGARTLFRLTGGPR